MGGGIDGALSVSRDSSVDAPTLACEQFRQPRQVAGRHGQGEAGSHALDAAIQGLRHGADGFDPAERFFDLLPAPLRFGIARVPGRSAVDGGMPGFLRDMGRDYHLPQFSDEIRAVVAAVSRQGQASCRSR